jgi:hypothetical protein
LAVAQALLWNDGSRPTVPDSLLPGAALDGLLFDLHPRNDFLMPIRRTPVAFL